MLEKQFSSRICCWA